MTVQSVDVVSLTSVSNPLTPLALLLFHVFRHTGKLNM